MYYSICFIFLFPLFCSKFSKRHHNSFSKIMFGGLLLKKKKYWGWKSCFFSSFNVLDSLVSAQVLPYTNSVSNCICISVILLTILHLCSLTFGTISRWFLFPLHHTPPPGPNLKNKNKNKMKMDCNCAFHIATKTCKNYH